MAKRPAKKTAKKAAPKKITPKTESKPVPPKEQQLPPFAPHVYQAIEDIAKEFALTGIDKTHETDNKSFKFRGIDDVMQALSGLQIKYKLRIMPDYSEAHSWTGVTSKGYPINYTRVKGVFAFVSTVDGSTHPVSTFGEAGDSGDKATAKAMSIAYKYAATLCFCIPLKGAMPDPDQNTYEFNANAQRPVDQDVHDIPPETESQDPDDGPSAIVLIPQMREALTQCKTAAEARAKAKTFTPFVNKLSETERDACVAACMEIIRAKESNAQTTAPTHT